MNILINSLIERSQSRSQSIFILIAVASLALAPLTDAVVPAPDGGYPGGNTAEGQNALFDLTTGGYNTAAGFLSLRSNAIGNFNTAVGAGALLLNTGDPTSSGEGDENTAMGAVALLSNTGASNTANGALALLNNTTGDDNSALGAHSLMNNSTGSQNVAVGAGALGNHVSGNNNIAIGSFAGAIPTEGDNNIYIGNGGVSLMGFEGNTIRIGANQQATFIAGINGASVMGAPVVVAGDGRLGITMSSRRFKKDVEAMGNASDALLALAPVTFHYKSDINGTPQFGLIAEEVARVNPALVLTDKEGNPYTVRYDAVNAMLLNEFLKEHRKVEDLESRVAKQEAIIAQQQKNFQAAIARQQKNIESVIARLSEHDSKIERVTDQIQLVAPAPCLAVSNR